MADTEQKESSKEQDDEEQVEKPKTFQYGYRIPGRTYVQPQWIWDCINAGKILRADLYAPGALLPPHLSPFVKPRQGEYDPTKSLAEQEREGEVAEFEEAEREAQELEGTAEDDRVDEEEDEDGEELGSDGGMQVAGSDEEDEDEDENEDDDDENEKADGRNGDAFGGFSDDDEESVSDEAQAAAANQAELEAEAQGLTIDEAKRRKAGKSQPGGLDNKSSARKRGEKKRAAEEEERQRRMGMMPRKKKKLYEKMQYGLKRDGDAAEKLRSKRRRIEGGRS